MSGSEARLAEGKCSMKPLQRLGEPRQHLGTTEALLPVFLGELVEPVIDECVG